MSDTEAMFDEIVGGELRERARKAKEAKEMMEPLRRAVVDMIAKNKPMTTMRGPVELNQFEDTDVVLGSGGAFLMRAGWVASEDCYSVYQNGFNHGKFDDWKSAYRWILENLARHITHCEGKEFE